MCCAIIMIVPRIITALTYDVSISRLWGVVSNASKVRAVGHQVHEDLPVRHLVVSTVLPATNKHTHTSNPILIREKRPDHHFIYI